MTEQKQWILRGICLVLILAMGAAYQVRAMAWQRQTEENRAQVQAAEAYNAEILAEQAKQDQQTEATGAGQRYADGSYTGSGQGFGGEITVTVTLSGGQITEITVDAHDGEDEVYFAEATGMIDRILSAQSADVDTITGATFSSTGIREAVKEALRQAGEAA